MTLSSPLQVPDGVTVLMSASRSSYSKLDRVFQFSMEYPVPSYLVALVAGDLQHVDVGPRSVPCSGPWVWFLVWPLILDPGLLPAPGLVPGSGTWSGSWSSSWFLTQVWFLVLDPSLIPGSGPRSGFWSGSSSGSWFCTLVFYSDLVPDSGQNPSLNRPHIAPGPYFAHVCL